MENNRKIKVLVIDDSRVFREFLKRGLSADSRIEVVGTATDSINAQELIKSKRPDVITLDIQMPGMSGIEFLKKVMPNYEIPVVVVSAVGNIVFDALSAGAVDFVGKPTNNRNEIQSFIGELLFKIKIAYTSRRPKTKAVNKANLSQSIEDNCKKIIAIGASTGGTEALSDILSVLPYNTPGIVIVQHMPPKFTKIFAERLNKGSQITVKEAENGDRIKRGLALLAPGGMHMRVKKSNDGYYVECFTGDKVNGHCPSVDVLFSSVSEKAGKDSIGVILTGMGYDGAKGLLMMKKNGSHTVGQNEETCVVYGMPRVAFNIGAVEKQVPLNKIPDTILSFLK